MHLFDVPLTARACLRRIYRLQIAAMISNLKRELLFGLVGVCAIAFIAGCTSSKPQPGMVETNPVPVAMPPPTPPPTNAWPVQISKPRPPADASDNMTSNILAWDAVAKEYQARPGETNAPFTFSLTNISPERVIIYDTSTTCDCTVAQLPSKPWTLAPGVGGQIHATLDLRGKIGAVTNYVIVFTSKGNRLLTVKATLPKPW
jgi:Protein of unknown function (DUF1573)